LQTHTADFFDVVIVGGGPAGLNAALVLGRARRNVAICDAGEPRNAVAEEMHGFLSRDGYSPKALDDVANEQLLKYPSITRIEAAVESVAFSEKQFVATLRDGRQLPARRILLATGMRDELPEVQGIAQRWGHSVFVCPHCDGWEFRGRRIGVFGHSGDAIGLAQELHRWSGALNVFGVDESRLGAAQKTWMQRSGVRYTSAKPVALEGNAQTLSAVKTDEGLREECDVLFLCVPLVQRSHLVAALGCATNEEGSVIVTSRHETTIEGVFACGDMVTKVHQVIVAASSGVQAAIAIDGDLLDEDLGRNDGG
jgi:thioredoxin reductase